MKLHQLGHILALSWHIVDQLGAISTLTAPWLHFCSAFGLVCPNLAPSWRPGRRQTSQPSQTNPNQAQAKAKPKQTKPNPAKPSQAQAKPKPIQTPIQAKSRPKPNLPNARVCHHLVTVLAPSWGELGRSWRHLDTILIRLAIFAKLGAIVAPAPKPNQAKPMQTTPKPRETKTKPANKPKP